MKVQNQIGRLQTRIRGEWHDVTVVSTAETRDDSIDWHGEFEQEPAVYYAVFVQRPARAGRSAEWRYCVSSANPRSARRMAYASRGDVLGAGRDLEVALVRLKIRIGEATPGAAMQLDELGREVLRLQRGHGGEMWYVVEGMGGWNERAWMKRALEGETRVVANDEGDLVQVSEAA